MRIVPSSSVTLYDRDLDMRPGQVLAFSSPANRASYMAKHIIAANAPCTYIKHTARCRVEIAPALMDKVGYISFINTNYENVTWYAFLTSYDEVNNECCEISYVLDPWMTRMFEFRMSPCMISRQHQSISNHQKGEENPYDPSIYEFRTAEDLGFGSDLEKSSYHIKKFYDQEGKFDGEYIYASKVLSTDVGYYYDMGHHVSAVIFVAPIDFNDLSFSTYAVSEDWLTLRSWLSNGISSFFEGKGKDNFISVEDAALLGHSLLTDEGGIDTHYADGEGEMPAREYRKLLSYLENNYLHRSSPLGLATASGLIAVIDRESNPSGIWDVLMEDIVEQGGLYFPSNRRRLSVDGISTITVSAMNRGYDIIVIQHILEQDGLDLFTRFIRNLTQWDAISQIVSIYALPDYIVRRAFIQADEVNDDIAISNYIAPPYVSSVPSSKSRLEEQGVTIAHKKLLLFPYSYLRVLSPDGNVKEYKYEEFENISSGESDNAEFRYITDLNAKPSCILTPLHYKNIIEGYEHVGVNMSQIIDVNLSESITFENFPEIPFVTDSYLTYLSQRVKSTFAENTLNNEEWRTQTKINSNLAFANELFNMVFSSANKIAGGIADIGNKDKSTVGGILSVAEGVASVPFGFLNAGAARSTDLLGVRQTETAIAESKRFLSGEVLNDELDWGQYNGVRPAYANQSYHAGTNGGIYNVVRGNCTIDFISINVQMNHHIIEKYENFFKYFGYNFAGKVLTPFIMNFLNNVQDDDIRPYWEDDDGYKITYVQTMNAKVSGVTFEEANVLESMFNNGVRFINGDELI